MVKNHETHCEVEVIAGNDAQFRWLLSHLGIVDPGDQEDLDTFLVKSDEKRVSQSGEEIIVYLLVLDAQLQKKLEVFQNVKDVGLPTEHQEPHRAQIIHRIVAVS